MTAFHSNPPLSQQESSRAGSVIIAVLGFVVLLSSILVAYLDFAADQIKYSANFTQNDNLRTAAYSRMEVVLAVIDLYSEIDGTLRGPSQGWDKPFQFTDIFNEAEDGISTTLEFEDESSKCPLQTANKSTISAALEMLGLDLGERDELTDTLIDWQDSNNRSQLNGFDGDDYEDMDPPYLPSNKALRTWDELYLIKGWKEHFWDESGKATARLDGLKQLFSLTNTGRINLNSVEDYQVLEMIEYQTGLDAEEIWDYLCGNDDIRGTSDDRYFEDLDNSLLSGDNVDNYIDLDSSLLKITLTVARGDARFSLTAFVEHSPTTLDEADSNTSDASDTSESEDDELNYPFNIIYTQENRASSPRIFDRHMYKDI